MINFKSEFIDILNEYNNLLKDASIPKLNNGYKPIYDKSILNLHDLILNESLKNEKVIIFAIDSISFEYFINNLYKFIKKDSKVAPVTSIFPSTTNTAWSSIITGMIPSKHGMVSVSFKNNSPKGSYIWLNDIIKNNKGKNYKVSSSIKIFNSKLKNIFLKTIGEHTYYGRHGFQDIDGKNTLLHYFLSKGAKKYNPFIKGSDYLDLNKILYDLETHIENIINLKTKGIDWMYLDIDTYIHKYGYTEELTNIFFKKIFNISYNLKNLGAKVIICSDHGQIEQGIIKDNIFELSKINNDLDIPVSGAGRTLFFYPKLGKNNNVQLWIKGIIKDKGWIFTKKECVEYGILDKSEINSDKIGDIIVIANKKGFPSTGIDSLFEHGGISKDEMIVPIILI